MSDLEKAARQALEALKNSVDLVSAEARNAEAMYANVPTRLKRVQGLVALEVAHQQSITTLRRALEQPAADPCKDGSCACCWTHLNEQPAQQPKNCRHCGGADTVICAGQCKQPAQQEPVAWMHTMDNTEGHKANKPYVLFTKSKRNPFGVAGRDYSKSYPVTKQPLYTRPQAREWVGIDAGDWNKIAYTSEFRAGADWAEAMLREKNT